MLSSLRQYIYFQQGAYWDTFINLNKVFDGLNGRKKLMQEWQANNNLFNKPIAFCVMGRYDFFYECQCISSVGNTHKIQCWVLCSSLQKRETNKEQEDWTITTKHCTWLCWYHFNKIIKIHRHVLITLLYQQRMLNISEYVFPCRFSGGLLQYHGNSYSTRWGMPIIYACPTLRN